MKSMPIGKILIDKLSEPQLGDLLTLIFNQLDRQLLTDLLEADHGDALALVKKYWKTQDKGKIQPPTARRSLPEEWNALWQEWDALVAELGDDEGEYACQKREWECSTFDGERFSRDLDHVADRMLPLLDQIFPTGLSDEGIYEDKLNEIETGIYEYPEWMESDNEKCRLGRAVTQCFLKWEWLASLNKTQPETVFFDRILEIERSMQVIELDEPAYCDYFLKLPDPIQRSVFEHLGRQIHQSAERKSDSVITKWKKIYHALSESYNPEKYLENCRALLPEDWHYAIPLVEFHLKKKEYQEAEKLIEHTFALFHREKAKPWQLEKGLLIDYFTQPEPDLDIIQLLKDWIDITCKLDKTDRQTILEFHLCLYQFPFDWDAVADAFHRYGTGAVQKTILHLFKAWKHYIVKKSLITLLEPGQDVSNTWIQWLIDFRVDQTGDSKGFMTKLESWLNGLARNPESFKKNYPLVYCLTQDIGELQSLGTQYPNLFSYIILPSETDPELNRVRRAWLNQVTGGAIREWIVECWKQNITCLVPDPSDARHSDYSQFAHWLQVVYELNPQGYHDLIESWKQEHKKRRNLWNAVKAAGLPV